MNAAHENDLVEIEIEIEIDYCANKQTTHVRRYLVPNAYDHHRSRYVSIYICSHQSLLLCWRGVLPAVAVVL